MLGEAGIQAGDAMVGGEETYPRKRKWIQHMMMTLFDDIQW
jgi:hypothetical protein